MSLSRIAGFVLVGGQSRRMGQDKALLPFRGRTLAEFVAAQVSQAAGSVTLIGPVAAYAHLGLEIVEDPQRGAGPLSGIVTALAHSGAAWSLVVACDMPQLSGEVLERLVRHALSGDADAVLARSAGGFDEPLLAVYRASCREPLERALAEGRWKVRDALAGLRVERVEVPEEAVRNANTPEEWARIGEGEQE